jgi:hypothetical protein
VGGGWNRLRNVLTGVEFEGGRWMEQAKERVDCSGICGWEVDGTGSGSC